jgi:hypothetical protein
VKSISEDNNGKNLDKTILFGCFSWYSYWAAVFEHGRSSENQYVVSRNFYRAKHPPSLLSLQSRNQGGTIFLGWLRLAAFKAIPPKSAVRRKFYGR